MIDNTPTLHQEGATSVGGLNDPKVLSALGQIKEAFGAFALIYIKPGGDRSQGVGREYDFSRPAATVAAAATVLAIVWFRFKLGGEVLIHCLCSSGNRSGRSRVDQDGG